jgi:hypothetical protein
MHSHLHTTLKNKKQPNYHQIRTDYQAIASKYTNTTF